MNNDEKAFYSIIRESLVENGEIIPTSEDEVAAMERILEEDGYPELPPHLSAGLLLAGLNQSGQKVVPFSSREPISDINSGLARAARKGKEEGISEEILQKMRKDRKTNESSKK